MYVVEVVGGLVYDEEFVGYFLVFFGYGVRSGFSEYVDGVEKSEVDIEIDGNVLGNVGVGIWGIDGMGIVGIESDLVSC